MKYKNFMLRLLSLVIIAGALFQYNTIAQGRQQLVEENKKKVAEAEAYNASVQALENGEEAASYADGTYEGTGMGFGGDVTVSVTVSGGKIKTVDIVSAKDEDPAYFNMAKAGVPAEIIEKQSTEVDTVSGATYSSKGIIAAAEDALSKAVK